MLDSAQVASLSGLGSSSRDKQISLVSSLFSTKSNGKLSAQAMQDFLTARYIDQPAAEVDFTDSLREYIAEHVDAETAGKLLGDLEALKNLTQGGKTADAIGGLLAGDLYDDEKGGGLLNLLV